MRLVAAELLKVRTAPRTTLGLVLGLLALVGLGSGATASDAGGEQGGEMVAWDLLEVASTATIFTLILGILVVTWEYRHGTITQTYLVTPRREWVIAAKLVVSFLLAAVLAVLAIAVVLAVARLWLSYSIDRGQWELAGRVVLGGALWGVLGAGLGALLQSQVGAIVGSFIWFLVAEALIGFQFDGLADYLPGAALDRLQGVDDVEAALGAPVQHPYSVGVSALLTGAYAAGLAVLGTLSAIRRDVP